MFRAFLLSLLLFCNISYGGWWFFLGAPVTTFTNTYSAQVDGSTENVDFTTDNLSTDSSSPLTVAVWIKFSSASTAYAFGTTGSANTPGYCFRFAGGGWGLLFTSGTLHYIYSNTSAYQTANDGTWHHLAVTYTGDKDAGSFESYYDGSPVDEDFTTNNGGPGDSSSSNGFNIGVPPNASLKLAATYGDLIVTNDVLTPTEISEIYNSGVSLNMRDFSDWSTFKASSASLWLTWEDDDFESANGVVDLTNGYQGTATDMTNASNKVEDSPTP